MPMLSSNEVKYATWAAWPFTWAPDYTRTAHSSTPLEKGHHPHLVLLSTKVPRRPLISTTGQQKIEIQEKNIKLAFIYVPNSQSNPDIIMWSSTQIDILLSYALKFKVMVKLLPFSKLLASGYFVLYLRKAIGQIELRWPHFMTTGTGPDNHPTEKWDRICRPTFAA